MKFIGATTAPVDTFDLAGARDRIRSALEGVELSSAPSGVPSGYEVFLWHKFGPEGQTFDEWMRGRRVADWTRQAYAFIARNPGGGTATPSMAKEQSTSGLLSVLGSVAKSNREAARIAGIDEKNLRRYRTGATPTEQNRRKLLLAVRRIRLKPGRERILRRQTPPVSAKATLRVSKDKRQRDIDLTDYVTQQDWNAVIDAYIGVGDLSGAVETMVLNAIEEYLSEADVESVDDVRIGAKR